MNPPINTYENVQLNERLWQAWICKNRELDRRGAVRRLRFLTATLVVLFAAAIVQNYIK